MSLSTTVKSIQDIMRKDAGTYGDAQRIEQLAWMFFLKILDDRETEEELLDDNFKSPLPEELRWRNWAADDEGMTGDTLLDDDGNEEQEEALSVHDACLPCIVPRSGDAQRLLSPRAARRRRYLPACGPRLQRRVYRVYSEMPNGSKRAGSRLTGAGDAVQ